MHAAWPQLTEQDLQQDRLQDIKTVIDFRLPSETPTPNTELAFHNGLDYVNISVNKVSHLDESD